ncbi:MAG TPA: group II intron reverse transcriptase/maturase [Pyrinomonadaceae bacterium]|nr:group II intron reverse transcriptase/maturase [Pyrinomonadaceae bacterium]
MTNRYEEARPAAVSETKQAGEVRAGWAWTEPCVWTERMLTALEEGVKGGVWFSLIDKVSAPRVLRWAFGEVEKNGGAAGVDHQTIAMYGERVEQHTEYLARTLKEGSYQPAAVRRVLIPKPGSNEKRPLGIPTVRDRVVQKALLATIEPIFEREFAEQSYGFRPGRGCKDALRRVDQLLQAGYNWVVDADLQKYFDTIPHESLMRLVEEKIADGRVLKLIRKYLEQGVLENMREWQPETGTPQGAVISPLLSNIYLNPLDHLMVAHGIEMVRYADDFVLLCRSEHEARHALGLVQQWTATVGLTLHPEKTRIVDATQPGGFDFLGYHFERGYKWPRQKSLKKLKDAIRAKTKRSNGQNLQAIIANVNRTTIGWFAYFKHSHRYTFAPLDRLIRVRLRSVLRKRSGRRGHSRGGDSRRWPNDLFTSQGLFSLVAAHAQLRQPLSR